MKLLIFLFAGMTLFEGFAQAVNMQDVREQPGFAAEIPPGICEKEFPFFKRIHRNLHSQEGKSSFDVFSFTTREFDPGKESVLVIHGGPGGMWGPQGALALANEFTNYNLIFFHYRGGGCSILPSLDIKFDKYLSTTATIGDMEGMRKAYGVSKWHAVIGFSYGTTVALRYAHFMPTHMKTLILEGLHIPDRGDSREEGEFEDVDPVENPNVRVLRTVRQTYETSDVLKKYIDSKRFEAFLVLLEAHFELFSAEQHYGAIGFWESYQPAVEAYFKGQGKSVPTYWNRKTFTAVTSLAYSSVGESSVTAISSLLSEFGAISLPPEEVLKISGWTDTLSYMFFPFLNPNYLDSLKSGQLVSYRVQAAMNANDMRAKEDTLCTSVDTLVINGTQDSATPVAKAQKFLKNKRCASAKESRGLYVEGGGHSSLTRLKCLTSYVNKVLSGSPAAGALQACEMPVKEVRY